MCSRKKKISSKGVLNRLYVGISNQHLQYFIVFIKKI